MLSHYHAHVLNGCYILGRVAIELHSHSNHSENYYNSFYCQHNYYNINLGYWIKTNRKVHSLCLQLKTLLFEAILPVLN